MHNSLPTMPDVPRIDWSQWIFPGPRRVFSAAELARAAGGGWSACIDLYVYSNVLVLVLLFYKFLPPALITVVGIAGVVAAFFGLWVARWLWRNPSRTRFNVASLGAGVVTALVPLAVVRAGHRDLMHDTMPLLAGGLALMLSSWWFLTLYRSQQLESRLREIEEQRERVALAQRLAAAQIQPHFLFNTLASLQHWVDTQDARGGPLLRSLTRYLRATLPMFEHERLPVAQELQIVRSYLDIMQARLGTRLTWSVEDDGVPESVLSQTLLPPGTLLTLAENAITHGIEPSLRGGHVAVRIHLAQEGHWLRLEVQDNGPGPSEGACDGVGLSNTRERLAVQSEGAAQMGLEAARPGCLAWIEWPLGSSSLSTAPSTDPEASQP
ncbi:histidine kinase [Roseateles sp. SL47]|uniref:sensor histidine kinase n=1 Tax=Roseateles sp. SL47 TaxID=2995138 RepID=UPI0022714287|nr:histidine kinase [Roseateles sp. SL47]WAC74370.1 histidine kinase [Roseateles sp. SL47]